MFLQSTSHHRRDEDHDELVRRRFPYMASFVATFFALDLVSVVVVLVAL